MFLFPGFFEEEEEPEEFLSEEAEFPFWEEVPSGLEEVSDSGSVSVSGFDISFSFSEERSSGVSQLSGEISIAPSAFLLKLLSTPATIIVVAETAASKRAAIIRSHFVFLLFNFFAPFIHSKEKTKEVFSGF